MNCWGECCRGGRSCILKLEVTVTGGTRTSGNLAFMKRTGSLSDCELNPEELESLWLITPTTWSELFWQGAHDWGSRAVHLLNYTLECPATEDGKPQSWLPSSLTLISPPTWSVPGTCCTDVTGISHQLPVGDLSQPLICVSFLQIPN
jgi:hypothetical protein